eukprot:TRINITY_DN7359_c0_g1_i1.p1 TRINITY_DN7359_c0_g1~~TRINITY_DN7359_c0_g1_i1.p1  ORF type:complete len:586 (-),score=101.86 TRINITY_DN7359_c0_g1_i1:244-2001(-)
MMVARSISKTASTAMLISHSPPDLNYDEISKNEAKHQLASDARDARHESNPFTSSEKKPRIDAKKIPKSEAVGRLEGPGWTIEHPYESQASIPVIFLPHQYPTQATKDTSDTTQIQGVAFRSHVQIEQTFVDTQQKPNAPHYREGRMHQVRLAPQGIEQRVRFERVTTHWTAEEDAAIVKVGIEAGSWKALSAKIMASGTRDCEKKTPKQCSQRFSRVLDPSIHKGSWTADEDARLDAAVLRYGPVAWVRIAADVGRRTDIQCRTRYVFRNRKLSRQGNKKASSGDLGSTPSAGNIPTAGQPSSTLISLDCISNSDSASKTSSVQENGSPQAENTKIKRQILESPSNPGSTTKSVSIPLPSLGSLSSTDPYTESTPGAIHGCNSTEFDLSGVDLLSSTALVSGSGVGVGIRGLPNAVSQPPPWIIPHNKLYQHMQSLYEGSRTPPTNSHMESPFRAQHHSDRGSQISETQIQMQMRVQRSAADDPETESDVASSSGATERVEKKRIPARFSKAKPKSATKASRKRSVVQKSSEDGNLQEAKGKIKHHKAGGNPSHAPGLNHLQAAGFLLTLDANQVKGAIDYVLN